MHDWLAIRALLLAVPHKYVADRERDRPLLASQCRSPLRYGLSTTPPSADILLTASHLLFQCQKKALPDLVIQAPPELAELNTAK